MLQQLSLPKSAKQPRLGMVYGQCTMCTEITEDLREATAQGSAIKVTGSGITVFFFPWLLSSRVRLINSLKR